VSAWDVSWFVWVLFIMNQLVFMLTCVVKMSKWICSWSCEEEAVKIDPAKGTLVEFRVNVMRITKNDKELICDKVMLTCKLEKSRSCCGSEVAET
jgi:hypothetical protein